MKEENKEILTANSYQQQTPAPQAEGETGLPKSRLPKNNFKLLLVALVVIAVIIAVATVLHNHNNSYEPRSADLVRLLTKSKESPRLGTEYYSPSFTQGEVDYSPQKLIPDNIEVPGFIPQKLDTESNQQNNVVFLVDETKTDSGIQDSLILYDLNTNKTFIVDNNPDQGNYYEPRIMGTHYVVYAYNINSDPSQPNTDTAIKIFDLSSGQSKALLTAPSDKMPVDICCSVSPDGLRLVIPQDGKMLVYQAGDTDPISIPADVKTLPNISGSDNSQLNAQERSHNYPDIKWLDNDRFMFALKPPDKWLVDSGGSHVSQDNNGLAIMNLKTNTATSVVDSSQFAIRWFEPDAGKIIFTSIVENNTGSLNNLKLNIADNISSIGSPTTQFQNPDIFSRQFYSPLTKNVYIQLYGENGCCYQMKSLDTETGSTADIPTDNLNFPDIKGIYGANQLIVHTNGALSDTYGLLNVKTGEYDVFWNGSEATAESQ